MKSKAKGSKAERELVKMFYNEGFMPLRSAGSGSTPIPCPDVLVGGKKRYLAIECKSTKKQYKYFLPEEINQLKLFAKRFGAKPLIGIKFNHKGWFFLPINKIDKVKKGNYVISLESAKKKGLTFDQISH